MKRIIPLLITLTLIACNNDSETYKINGNADGFSDGTKVFVFEIVKGQPASIDTLLINNEKFQAKYPKTEDISIRYFQVENFNSSIVFFPENVDLNAVFFKDSIGNSYVTGSPQNDAYKSFVDKLRSFNSKVQNNMQRIQQAKTEQDDMLASIIQRENNAIQQEEKTFKRDFALSNPNSLFSVMLMNELLARKEVNFADAEQLLSNLSPKVAASSISRDLEVLIASSKKAEVGAKAPDFSGPTPTGETLSLQQSMGKYTLIDFWASWCRPCRMENPNVVRVYNKYHEKGLNIISVSLDKPGQKERWLKAIEDDKMDWYHISNLKFWNDPVAKMYNVRSIPATFLIDEDGNIIAKNLRGPALEAKIASLLGN